MHLRLSLAAFALMGLCSSVSLAQGNNAAAQGGGNPQWPAFRNTEPTTVGLVDVGFVIKNHPTMKDKIDAIKAEMEKAQLDLDARRKELLAQGDQLSKTYDSSSPDFKQKQEELFNKESRLRVDFMEKEKEYQERHATLLATSYQDITESIEWVATQFKANLVIRYSKEQDEMDPKKPQTVQFAVMKDVLYKAPDMDLTQHVMIYLNHKLATAQTSQQAQPAAQTATRPAQTPGRAVR